MADMMSNLYGNPHSGSPSSQLSTNRIEDIRHQVLQFFNADPDEFDVVFVANATAGIKLVMECLRVAEGGFDYAYHKDAHTSLVGMRESAVKSRCVDDSEVKDWLSGHTKLLKGEGLSSTTLFAYPAQSNMDGRRLPVEWCERARKLKTSARKTYTLLDAAAFVSTAHLDLSDSTKAADFTVLSFYKIFGYPDLGALIVRKESGHVLKQRKYFGGGTVDVVTCVKEQWHISKTQSIHESLEDGTLPIHSIVALDAAIASHKKLYESMDKISNHTAFLAKRLYDGLSSMRHANGSPVCVMHSGAATKELKQGPVVTFNVRNSKGAWVTNTEFERLASVKGFHIRTGGLCNPGGLASCLELEPWEMRRNFSAGFKCGSETDIYSGKITGVIRASLGAMSIVSDVEAFLSFVNQFYVDDETTQNASPKTRLSAADFQVESLTIFPIKSCGGMAIPSKTPWEVRPEGLAWDREWCLLHTGTGQALSQKRHPRMALLRSFVDFESGHLRVWYHEPTPNIQNKQIRVPLSMRPDLFKAPSNIASYSSRVCGDSIVAQVYASDEINNFFTSVLSVPCVLARFPAGGTGFMTRHSKAHLQQHQQSSKVRQSVPGAFPDTITPPDSDNEHTKPPILLSNESPILAINRASIDALNTEISKTGGKSASPAVFRANIVLAPTSPHSQSQAYTEDQWRSLVIRGKKYDMLGSCRRCHMICVDQDTAEKNEEPFVSLAQTRRFDGKVFFGVHMCLDLERRKVKFEGGQTVSWEGQCPMICVGDAVIVDVDVYQ